MKQSDWLLAALAVTRQNTSPASTLFTLNLFLTDFSLSLFSFLSLPVSSCKNGSSHWPSYMPHEKSSYSFFLALILQPLSMNILFQQQLISRPGVDKYQELTTLLYHLQPKSVTCCHILMKVCKSGPHWRQFFKHYIWWTIKSNQSSFRRFWLGPVINRQS